MKKNIITGCARTGSTALVYLLDQSKGLLVTNELKHVVDCFFRLHIEE